jgi:hypothetical protein
MIFEKFQSQWFKYDLLPKRIISGLLMMPTVKSAILYCLHYKSSLNVFQLQLYDLRCE